MAVKRLLIAAGLFCLLLAPRAEASWSLIAHTSVTCATSPCNNNTALTTSAINTTGADLIVVGITFYPGGAAGCTVGQTVSDSKGNTWTVGKTVQDNGTSNGELDVAYVQSPTVGSGHTFSINKECYSTVYVLAFSGSTSSPLDQTNSGSHNTNVTSQASGSITPAQNNELIISGFLCPSAVTAISVDSSMTQSDAAVAGVGNQSYGEGLAWIAQTSATAINPTWSWTTAQTTGAVVLSFKAPGAPPPVGLTRALMGVGQ